MTDHNLREPRERYATMPFVAEHCEAKLHGFRRTQDGVVVSFVLHPQEVPQALALDPLGTRYMLAFAAIGDDEQPVSPAGTSTPDNERATFAAKDRTPEPQSKPAGELQRQRYATMSAGEQAVVRAAMLPKDERFRAWAAERRYPEDCADPLPEAEAIEFIQAECCGGKSRKFIADVPEYHDRFLKLEMSFKMDIGEMARPR